MTNLWHQGNSVWGGNLVSMMDLGLWQRICFAVWRIFTISVLILFFSWICIGFVVTVFNNRQLACSPPCVSVICYYVVNDMPGQNGCTSKKMPHKRDVLYSKVGVLKNVLAEM